MQETAEAALKRMLWLDTVLSQLGHTYSKHNQLYCYLTPDSRIFYHHSLQILT